MTRGWQSGWEKQSARINALSLRERVFLLFTVMACCFGLVDVLWLSPALLAHQQLTQRFEKQSNELRRARDTLKLVTRPGNANQAVRSEIAAVKSRLEAVNQNIKELSSTATQMTSLAQALVPLLRRHEGLTLVRTASLAPEVVANATAAGALTRQGMELTVSGSYAELTRYLQTLELALPAVRWGAMRLKADKQPPELTLQLFLVGVQP